MTKPTRLIDLEPHELDAARSYLAERSERKPNGCTEWTLSLHGPDGKGRPIAAFGGRRFIASRLAWHLERGPIPDGMLLCHRCDNPRCVDVGHLFLGTPADNAHDRDRKGRHRPLCGEAHPHATVPDVKVAAALHALASGATVSAVSRSVGVTRATVRRWRDGQQRRSATERELPGQTFRSEMPGQLALVEVTA